VLQNFVEICAEHNESSGAQFGLRTSGKSAGSPRRYVQSVAQSARPTDSAMVDLVGV
jgi:hypothetical protein